MKTIIRNATVVDGTGAPRFAGEVAFEDDCIVAVGPQLSGLFDREIDAGGQIVCPGFIDTHSHSDLFALCQSAIEPKIYQGITTDVLGQDGISMAPLPRQHVTAWRQNIGGLEGDSDEISWNYPTVKEYFAALRAQKPCQNHAYLAPHGNIRLEVMGFSGEHATEEQLCAMEQVLRRELEAGAIGMSSGLIYIPCVYASTEELIRLCKVVHEYDKVFVVHQRFEGKRIIESMQELKKIVLASGVRLHISHFKMLGREFESKRQEAFAILDELRQAGIHVSCDQYPYGAGSTMLAGCIPPWAHVGGAGEMLKRLRDPETREKIKHDIMYTDTVWDNFVEFCTPDGIMVTSVESEKNQYCVGKTIVEIGAIRGCDPIDAMMDLLLEEDNKVGMVEFYGTEECVMDIMKRPEVNICTDGLLGGTPHPRVYGAFPRVLGKYVREKQFLTLEEAVHKMTGKAADAMRMTQRGLLQPGKKADIVIFDLETITDVGDFINPRQLARGVRQVIVNGKTVLDEQGLHADAASGEVLTF